jgi:hypothetical protein
LFSGYGFFHWDYRVSQELAEMVAFDTKSKDENPYPPSRDDEEAFTVVCDWTKEEEVRAKRK